MPDNPKNDPFQLHKIALQPFLGRQGHGNSGAVLKIPESVDLDKLVPFLQRQGLAQLWLQMLLAQENLSSRFNASIETLKNEALTIAAGQLMQKKVLHDVLDAFAGADIDYLVFKGAHLRHTLYTDPTHRWVCDIDILVRGKQKLDAVRALLQTGFSAHHAPENISHETSLVKNGVSIDLHWHLLRPGRTRVDLNDYLFDQRRTCGDFEGLSKQASLLVMLVHPAITKYVNGEGAALIRLVDVHRLLQCYDIDEGGLVEMLGASGTCTAAWATLSWLQLLANEPMHASLTRQLKPGSFKAGWLNYWMEKDLNLKLAQRRSIIRACFSLVLQDSMKDALNAISALRAEKHKAADTLSALQQLE